MAKSKTGDDLEERQFREKINPNTGKAKGKAGRPSNEWKEFQEFQAWKALRDAGLDGFRPSSINSEGEEEGSKSAGGRLLEGFGDLINNPIIASYLTSFGGIATALGSLWLAEEYLKLPMKKLNKAGVEETTYVPFPPFLHSILLILTNVLSWLYNNGGDIKESVDKQYLPLVLYDFLKKQFNK